METEGGSILPQDILFCSNGELLVVAIMLNNVGSYYTYTYTYTYTHIHIHINTDMNIHTRCTYIYTHIYLHIHMYSHMQNTYINAY